MNVTDMHQNKSLAQPFCIGAASPLVIGRNCANGRIIAWLLMDSRELGKKTTKKGRKESLTALTGIMNKLKEAQIQG
jgi:hypothetical protein